jgi:signal recognition particle subunit SRP54
MMGKMLGMGGGGAPSEAEMARMQEELGKLDPKALEQLPSDLKDAISHGPAGGKGFGGIAGLGGLPKGLPGLGGGALPGLGGPLSRFPGLPGKKK